MWRKRSVWIAVAVVAMGCGSRSPLLDGQAAGGADAGDDSALPVDGGLPDVAVCRLPGAICGVDEDCCSSACQMGRCVDPLAFCAPGDPSVQLAQWQLATTGVPDVIALDEAHVYFTVAGVGSVRRVFKGGGATETLTNDADADVRGVALFDNTLVFADGKGVHSVDRSGGAVTTLATSQAGARFVAVYGGRVYWTDGQPAIRSVPVGGGAVTDHVVVSVGNPIRIAVDDQGIFWSRTGGPINVLAHGADTLFALGSPQSIGDFVLDCPNAYFTDNCGSPCGTIVRAPKDKSPTVFLAQGLPFPTGIATDASFVYWSQAEAAQPGQLMRTPKLGQAGGAPEVVVANAAGPSSVAVDGSCLYWLTRTGSVRRAPKSP